MTDIVDTAILFNWADNHQDDPFALRVLAAAAEITELRRQLALSVEQFQLIEKLASHERIYEVNRETGKRERCSLHKVVKVECEAAITALSSHIARHGADDHG